MEKWVVGSGFFPRKLWNLRGKWFWKRESDSEGNLLHENICVLRWWSAVRRRRMDKSQVGVRMGTNGPIKRNKKKGDEIK